MRGGQTKIRTARYGCVNILTGLTQPALLRSVRAVAQPTSTQKEEWRDIPGHEGKYQASSLGRIRSLDRYIETSAYTQFRKGKVLKPGSKKKGHLYVSLGKGQRRYVHRLVAATFIGEIPPGMLVRHLNDIPSDNRVENLAIGNMSDNLHDAVRNGRHAMANRTTCKKGHPYSEENTYIIPGSGSRACRTCAKIDGRKWYEESRPEGWEPRKLGHEITECPYGHAFIPENTRRLKKSGSKICVACSRARSYIRYHQDATHDFQQVSDSYYRSIMAQQSMDDYLDAA